MHLPSLLVLLTCVDGLRAPSTRRHRTSTLSDFPSHAGYTGPETTPLLDQVALPSALKRFDIKQVRRLPPLCPVMFR